MSARRRERAPTGRTNLGGSRPATSQLSARARTQLEPIAAAAPAASGSETQRGYMRGTMGSSRSKPEFPQASPVARPRTTMETGRSSARSAHLFAKTARSEAVSDATSGYSAKGTSLISSFHEIAHDDPEEFLATLQKQRDRDRRRDGVDMLPEGPNQFSRPAMSSEVPLRSLFLDPSANNLPRSNTQSDLRKNLRTVNMPHSSYDIDGDGYVSQEDYFLSKRFDLDGNGVLDPDEQEVGRFIMAQDFFRNHRDDIRLYGDEWKGTEAENIERLATANTFQKMLNKLKETEKHYRDIGSKNATACLIMADRRITQHNFYADKFDTTAWNDYGANPRSTTRRDGHSGSRENMYHLRKTNSRDVCQGRLEQHEKSLPQFSKARSSMITNWSIENG